MPPTERWSPIAGINNHGKLIRLFTPEELDHMFPGLTGALPDLVEVGRPDTSQLKFLLQQIARQSGKIHVRKNLDNKPPKFRNKHA